MTVVCCLRSLGPILPHAVLPSVYQGFSVVQSVQGEVRATKRRIVSRSLTDWTTGSAVQEGLGLPGSFFHIYGLESVVMGEALF